MNAIAISPNNERSAVGCTALVTRHSSLITHHQKLAHSGYVIGSNCFREDIERALKLRAMPRGPGRQPTRLAV